MKNVMVPRVAFSAFSALVAAVLLCTFAALSARAEVLVYEGFHPSDYGITTGTGTKSANNGNTTGNYTTNVVTGGWNGMGGSQITVYGADFGLALPAEMTAAGFSAQGGAIGLNPGNTSAEHRAMSHNLTANTLKRSSGTLYFRMLLNLDSTAAKKLAAGASLAQKNGGYFGFGFGKSPSGNDYYAPTHLQSAISFVIWKNSSNQYVLSFVHTTASGTSFTSYPIITDIALGTTYLCYAEVKVGAGTDGKEILRAGAMAVDAYTTSTPWAELANGSDSVEVELITDSSYPTCMAVAGPYGTKDGSTPGYFRADEIVVGTEIEDVLLVSTTKPKLSDGSLSLSGGTYTASATLAQSAANVTYTLSDGDDATTETPVALGVGSFAADSTATGTFAAPTDDTTYEVILTAENTGGETAELSLGTIYGGTLTLAKVSDGNELGCVPAMLTVSRANPDPLPLVVNYAFADGTAIAGVNYVNDAGYVTIPANATSATITVTPIVDAATATDTSLTVSIAAGNYTAPASGVAVAIVNFTTPAGYNYWIGGTATDGKYLASTAANWTQGHAPTAAENIVFDGAFSTDDCEWDAAASATVASWTQTNGYTGIVTFKTTFAEADAAFTSLAITGNADLLCGKWTLPTATSAQTSPLYRIKVSVGGSLTVANGAAITVTGKAPWSTVNGCAYGGSCDSSSAYGNVLEPADPGQSWPIPGGASGEYLHPAFGGGAIWLEVAGATVLDGSILANGGYSKGWDHYYGSGGGIYLKTASLSGSGTISADGNSTGGSNGGNASAGGRISILLTDAAEMALPLANVHALGSSEYSHTGGAGTIVIRTTTLTKGRLVVRNLPAYGQYKYYPPKERTTPVLAGETWTFDEVVFGANGVLRVPESATLSLPNGLASVSGSSDLGANLGFCGILLDGGALDISDTAATEHVVGNGAWMLSPNGPLTLNGSLTVQDGAAVGAIRLYNSATNNFTKMDLTVKGDMTVTSGSYILAEGAGLTGGGAAVFAGTEYGAHGGSHGASSAEAAPVDGGYDSILSPTLPGNSGSGAYRYGSGVVLLKVDGALTLDGTASANAIGGHWYGAAGTINITAGSLSGSGTITANGNRGGNWDADNNYHLYPGGGRVAVRLTDAGATFAERWPANIQALGVAWNAGDGTRLHHTSSGTVYLQDGTQGEGRGTVRVFQNNATVNWTTVCTNDFTAFPSTRHGGENDDLRGVALEIGGGAHVLVSVDKARADSLSIAEHSTLNLNGKTLSVKSAKLGENRIAPGTYTVAQLEEMGISEVVDTADGAGGSLVIAGGFFLIVR